MVSAWLICVLYILYRRRLLPTRVLILSSKRRDASVKDAYNRKTMKGEIVKFNLQRRVSEREIDVNLPYGITPRLS